MMHALCLNWFLNEHTRTQGFITRHDSDFLHGKHVRQRGGRERTQLGGDSRAAVSPPKRHAARNKRGASAVRLGFAHTIRMRRVEAPLPLLAARISDCDATIFNPYTHAHIWSGVSTFRRLALELQRPREQEAWGKERMAQAA